MKMNRTYAAPHLFDSLSWHADERRVICVLAHASTGPANRIDGKLRAHRMSRVAAILLLACCAGSVTAAESNDPTAYEPISRSTSEITKSSFTTLRSERLSLSDEGSKRGLAGLEVASLGESSLPVDTLRIREQLLHGPGAQGSAAGGIGFGALPQDRALQLSIEGQTYTLSIVEEIQDLKRGVRYVSAAMPNDPAGYARFTIDGSSGQVVGSLHTSSDDYRIVPHSSGQQLVFRKKLPESLAAGQQRALSKLERIHQRAEMLAAIQPSRARIEEGAGHLFIQDGSLGSLRSNSPEAIRAVIQRLAALTSLDVAPSIRITGIFASAAGTGPRIIRFEQVINGIPVERRNEIRVDAAGKVTEVNVAFVDPESVPARTLLTAKAAERSARKALDFELRGAAGTITLMAAPELKYAVANAQLELTPLYTFDLATAAGEPYSVTVDASTGQTQVLSGVVYVVGDQFRHRICRRIDAPGASNPQQCPISNVQPVLTERTDTPGSITYKCEWTFTIGDPANPCTMPKHTTPKDVIHSVDAAWEQATASNPGVCCSNVGGTDDRVDVVVGSAVTGSAGYIPTTDTILLPDNYALNPDAIAHETAHAHQEAYNGPLLPSSGFKLSVAEGLADAATGVWAEKTAYPGSGTAWVIGDGTSPTISPRDLRTPRTFADLDASGDVHVQGAVIGNFFYRLRQSGAATLDRLLAYVLEVESRVVDVNGDGMDLYDLKRALTDSVRPSETALLNAVNQTFSTMNNVSTGPGGSADIPAGPGQPGAPNAPPPPTNLSGTPFGCRIGPQGAPLSYYNVSFTLSPGATSYDGFFRSANGIYYGYGGSGTSSPSQAGANFNTILRLRACNANGCSSLSTSSVTITANLCN